MDLIYFILICAGMTQIVVYGSIFNWARPAKEFLNGFGELFHCSMCMGFWVGFFVWALSPWVPSLFTYEQNLLTGFLLSCLSSGTSYMLNTLIADNGIQIGIEKGD